MLSCVQIYVCIDKCNLHTVRVLATDSCALCTSSNKYLLLLLQPTRGGDAMLSMIRLPEHFRLEHLQEEFDLATDDELNNSKRYCKALILSYWKQA